MALTFGSNTAAGSGDPTRGVTVNLYANFRTAR